MALPLRHWYFFWTHFLKWGDSFWVLVAHTSASIIGLFQKKIQTGVVETYFLQKLPGIFRFVPLSLEVLEKTKLHLRKFHKIVLQLFGIPRLKTRTHGNSTWLFWLAENCTLFYLIPGIFICFSRPLEIPCPHSFNFFLE